MLDDENDTSSVILERVERYKVDEWRVADEREQRLQDRCCGCESNRVRWDVLGMREKDVVAMGQFCHCCG